jgi:hypothetical protein
MQKDNFNPPIDYGDWYVFPNSSLVNLKTNDCISSATGKCEQTDTLEECIKLCAENKNCGKGYYIETPDKKNICVPTALPKGTLSIGPYFRIINKNAYPELQNLKSTVFVSKRYKFPPDHANSIFYTDKFTMTSLFNNMNIGIEKGGKLVLENQPQKTTFIQFLPKQILRSYISKYLLVNCGDDVVLNIPNTAYILKKDEQNIINWQLALSGLDESGLTFQVRALNKKIGEPLDYEDSIYLTDKSLVLIFDETDNQYKLSNINPENQTPNRNKFLFKLSPHIQCYYCEDKECKKIELDKTERQGEKARYKNIPVSRHPFCWGACQSRDKYTLTSETGYLSCQDGDCNPVKTKVKNQNIFIVLGVILFFLILLTMIIWAIKKF